MMQSAFEDELKYTEKTCPRCGALLFADMDVCYSCLYDFKRNLEELEEDVGFSADSVWDTDKNKQSNTLPWDALEYEDEYEASANTSYTTSGTIQNFSADTWDLGLAPSWYERDPDAQDDFFENNNTSMQTCDLHKESKLVLQTSDVRCLVPLDKKLLIGRHGSADICLSSPAISKYHVSIRPIGDAAEVCDLGAKNKARYKGRDIQGTIHIQKGDSISICGASIKLV